MNRDERRLIAEDTLKQLPNYNNHMSELIEIKEHIKIEQGKWYSYNGNTDTNSIMQYVIKNKENKKTILNFASAKNPGGGFLNGSNAQEESIARCSSLYGALTPFIKSFYEPNRVEGNPLYTDKMIYSNDIEVFKSDNGKVISPVKINVITSPAPNAGVALKRNISEREIDVCLKNRIYNIIQLAVNQKVESLALGAFGCGVFNNDSKKVAMHFKNAINQLVEKDSMEIKFVFFGTVPSAFMK